MHNQAVTIPSDLRFLIVGSGDPVKSFLKKIKEVFPHRYVYVLSDKNCDELWSIHEKKSINKVAEELGYEIDLIEEINTIEVLNKIKKNNCNICFVLGSKWIIKPDLINYFNGAIFNYHTSNLPEYKGGGGYRWQAMNDEGDIFVSFHQLTVDIDSGPILKTYKKNIPDKLRYPKDFFDNLYTLSNGVFVEFLNMLDKKILPLYEQDQKISTYFPLLDNEINGAIDLSWDIYEIVKFIEAFSYPYKGAFLYYQNKKYFFKEAEINGHYEKYHPFATGLIVNISYVSVDIIVNGGVLSLKNITDEHGDSIDTKIFFLGGRFYMPHDLLLEGKLHRPSNKTFTLKVN